MLLPDIDCKFDLLQCSKQLLINKYSYCHSLFNPFFFSTFIFDVTTCHINILYNRL